MSEITLIEGNQQSAPDVKVGIVASRFNKLTVDRLLDGCLSTLTNNGIQQEDITLVRVPGAFEIPVAVKSLIDYAEIDVVITLGAIIRGETPHFDFIATECANGISSIAIQTGVPVIFGVLTVDNIEQAQDRSGAEESNKGVESALAALEMVSVIQELVRER